MRRTTITLATTAALLSVGALAAPAEAADITVREADLVPPPLQDVRGEGTYEFLRQGVHISTTASAADKVALYFSVAQAFPATGDLDWAGTAVKPSVQIVFDVDGMRGNGNDYNVLVGEEVYGDNWWLTNGSSQDAKDADPSGEDNSGNGSDYFGTLVQWGEALPDADFLAGGFSLGSGQPNGNGVVKSISYDGMTYEFTSDPEPEPEPEVVAVAGKASMKRLPAGIGPKRALQFTFTSDETPDGAVQGAKLRWRVSIDGRTVYSDVMGADEVSRYSKWFPRRSGKHTYVVFKNGRQVKQGSIVVR